MAMIRVEGLVKRSRRPRGASHHSDRSTKLRTNNGRHSQFDCSARAAHGWWARTPARTASTAHREVRPSPRFRNAGAVLRLLGVWDGLVDQIGDAALDGLGVEEAHGLLVAGLAEEALAGPEHDREDLQPQLVDQVVLQQRT